MKLEEFFEKIIDGYLFLDLASMAEDTDNNGGRGGGVGYPMLQTIMSGIELLGAIISKNYKANSSGEGYYSRYWIQVLSKYKPEYKIHRDLFRELIRHGIAHIYLPKGPIAVTKERYSSHLSLDHLRGIEKPVFIIDVLTFYEDFKKSYENFIRPIVFENKTSKITTFDQMQNRIIQILESDKDQIEKIFEKIKKYHIQQIINGSNSRVSSVPVSDIIRQLRIDNGQESE
jgi:hypothetical protein